MENLEQQAIRRVLAGEPDAYRLLMERHLPAVLRMTLRVTGSVEDAEEAAQEAFLRAYNKLPNFREHSAFGTWVYRIAMNCSLNLVERRSRDLSWHATSVHTSSQGEDMLPSSHPTPEAVLLEKESARERERMLSCLTPLERSAFLLRHLEDQPIATIAEVLGMTPNNARQTIFRAASKLRQQPELLRAVSARPCTQTQLARKLR